MFVILSVHRGPDTTPHPGSPAQVIGISIAIVQCYHGFPDFIYVMLMRIIRLKLLMRATNQDQCFREQWH